MMKLKTKTTIRRRAAQMPRGLAASPRRSQAVEYRNFWMTAARAWRLIAFNDRLHGVNA